MQRKYDTEIADEIYLSRLSGSVVEDEQVHRLRRQISKHANRRELTKSLLEILGRDLSGATRYGRSDEQLRRWQEFGHPAREGGMTQRVEVGVRALKVEGGGKERRAHDGVKGRGRVNRQEVCKQTSGVGRSH